MIDDPLIDVITVMVEALEQVGIPYAITGSIASSVHGEPFQSQDVDFAIQMTVDQARSLHQTLPQRFYRSPEHLEQVARMGGMANLIDTGTSLKVDLSVLRPGDFFATVLSRRVPASFAHGGPTFYTVSPEDVILMKLDWRRDSKSQKQWENALSVARVKGARMDWKYLFAQAAKLDLTEDLTSLRDEAGI